MADQLPLDALLAHPAISLPRLAPDGVRVASLRPSADTVSLVITAGLDGNVLHTAHIGPVNQHRWTQDGECLLFTADVSGDEGFHVYAFFPATGDSVDLTPVPRTSAVLLGVAGHVVALALNSADLARHDLFHVDLRDGQLQLVEQSRGFLPGGWLLDGRLQPRGAFAIAHGGRLCLWSRAGEVWTEVRVFSSEDAVPLLDSLPIGLTQDGGAAYLLSSCGGDFNSLVAVDLMTGHDRQIAQVDGADVVRVVTHDAEPLLLSSERDRVEWSAIGEQGARLLAVISDLTDEAGDTDLDVVDHTDDARTWLVARCSPTHGRTYVLIDLKAEAVIGQVLDRPWLAEQPMAAPEPFSFQARDGLLVHGYLTRPVGATRQPPPAVLWVHGGPWERDSWVFNLFVQFFASRGYACVQVNFRGSTGYGNRFIEAARREWGAAMQDDLLDAVDHLVGQAEIDSGAVAIAGGSYGGYAALVGATFTPDRFRCAIAIVAPSDLATLINSFPAQWEHGIRRKFIDHVGDPDTESELLRSRSPLSRVQDVRIPILMFHGAHDPRVRQAESDSFAAALRHRGVECQYVVFPDEGHGLTGAANRRRLLEMTETFLARHLAPADD